MDKEFFLPVIQKNVMYDPYANQVYIKSSDAITNKYREFIRLILDDDDKRKHAYALANFGRYTVVNGIVYLDWYKEYIKSPDHDLVKKFRSEIEYSLGTEITDKELSEILKNGWLVKKIGPTETRTDFKGFIVPIRFIYAIGTTTPGGEARPDDLPFLIVKRIDILHKLEAEEKTPPSVSKSIEEKLIELKRLYDAGLITESEYKTSREKVLNGL